MATPAWLLQFGLLLDLISGALFLILGALVAAVRPRRALNFAFAGLAAAIGVAYFFANLGPDYLAIAGAWVIAVYLVAATIAVLFVLVVATRFPVPLGPTQRGAVGLASTFALGTIAFQAVVLALFVERFGLQPFSGLPEAWFIPGMLSFWTFLDSLAFFLLLLAARLPKLEGPTAAKQRRQSALVTLALLPYLGLAASGHAMRTFGSPARIIFLGYGVLVVLCLAIGALWFRHAATAARGERGLPHAVGWVCFAVPLLGSLFVLATPDWNKVGILGLSRVAGVLVLAYAIVRQQLFDIDLRIKWTVRRGSLAGVFVAVFFMVDQVVQNWAGQSLGAFAGAIAAGLLLFALHPLQRLAQRVADATMPGVHEDDPNYVLDNKRDTYRHALAIAWSDGLLTVKEMRMLASLRDSLGLPENEIVALEGEWARGIPRTRRKRA